MPNWPYNDEHITDRSAIEQCRIRRNSGFQACIDSLSEMGAILSECAEVGWKAFEEKSCQYLMGCLGGTSAELERSCQVAAEAHAQTEFEGGDEHYILLFSEEHRGQRVLKWTYGGNFGLHLKVFEIDPDAMNHHVISSENPTHQEIVEGFRKIDFIEVSEHSYYRAADNVLLGDAAPRNIRFENGVLIPFDAVAEHPEGIAKEWCVNQLPRSK